jgi:hypothetical protein
MKKKILIAMIVIIMATASIVLYSNYARARIQYHVNSLNISSSRMPPSIREQYGLEGKVELQRVIKQSPGELVMLVKWGDDTAFVSIENWLAKHTGRTQVRIFEKGRGFTRYY